MKQKIEQNLVNISPAKNLESYRYNSFRGSDDAVKNIGSTEQNKKLKSIIENPKDFSR